MWPTALWYHLKSILKSCPRRTWQLSTGMNCSNLYYRTGFIKTQLSISRLIELLSNPSLKYANKTIKHRKIQGIVDTGTSITGTTVTQRQGYTSFIHEIQCEPSPMKLGFRQDFCLPKSVKLWYFKCNIPHRDYLELTWQKWQSQLHEGVQ